MHPRGPGLTCAATLVVAALTTFDAPTGATPPPAVPPATSQSAAVAAAATPTPRTGEVAVERPGTGAELSVTVHVDRGLQRIGIGGSFTPAGSGTWGRVWFGERDGGGGCTREIVVQGRSPRIVDWEAHEAGGAAIPVAADYPLPTSDWLLRLQLERPGLPDGCAVAELWSGTASGPTQLLEAGARRVTRAAPDGSLDVGFPVKFRLPWGETTHIPIEVRTYLSRPSAVRGLSVGLGPANARQGAVVDADSTPVDWDFWAEGSPLVLDLPITPVQPWGTRALPAVTSDGGTWPRGFGRKLKITHPPQPSWDDSLAGQWFWKGRTSLREPETRSMMFLDDRWVLLRNHSQVVPRCTETNPRWGRGCHRYWYDAATGRLQIGRFQARVTHAGGWWRGEYWNRSHQARTIPAGETRRYHGRGVTDDCCPWPRAEVWLRRDGGYRLVRGGEEQRGHYRALERGSVRLDPGAPGGRTRTVTLVFFGRLDDGEWRVHRVRFGDTTTRPS